MKIPTRLEIVKWVCKLLQLNNPYQESPFIIKEERKIEVLRSEVAYVIEQYDKEEDERMRHRVAISFAELLLQHQLILFDYEAPVNSDFQSPYYSPFHRLKGKICVVKPKNHD